SLDHDIGIENTCHQLFTEGGRHGGKSKLDFLAGAGSCLDAAVLGPAFFHDVHAAQDFNAAGHRGHDRRGNLVDLVQHAVDAEAYIRDVPSRFDVNIAGAF